MELREYVFKYEKNNKEFAEKCGISVTSLCMYKKKRTRPHPETAKRIYIASNGIVTIEELRG